MCVGDLSNALGSAQIHTGLSTSTWRGRGPGAGRFVRCLGPLPLCVVLLVQATRNDTSDRCLGPAAESTLSGMGRPCRCFQMRGWRGTAVPARGGSLVVWDHCLRLEQIHAGLSKLMWRGLGRPRLGRNRGPQGFGPGCCVRGFADAGQWKRHSRPRPLAVPPPRGGTARGLGRGRECRFHWPASAKPRTRHPGPNPCGPWFRPSRGLPKPRHINFDKPA